VVGAAVVGAAVTGFAVVGAGVSVCYHKEQQSTHRAKERRLGQHIWCKSAQRKALNAKRSSSDHLLRYAVPQLRV
jgi:hypothetical protein